MSVVEKLEELLKNRPIREKYLLSGPNKGQATSHAAYEEWFENFEREFVALEKACVIVPRKQLEERILGLAATLKPHDVCCLQCLEKGQLMALSKLLGVEK